MAKFTSTAYLNLRLPGGFEAVGVAGTTHRIPDALATEFERDQAPHIPGFAWVTQDEATSVVTLPIAQVDVTGLTADLATKYDKTGGTISGAATITGTLGVIGAVTASSSMTILGAANLSSTLGVSGTATLSGTLNVNNGATLSSTLTVLGAANLSSTLGVTGKATLGSSVNMGGTSFPSSPITKDTYYRSDLGMWFFYDGTRWLSMQLFERQYDYLQNISATSTDVVRAPGAALNGGSDIYIEQAQLRGFTVAGGGTALGASHKWVITYRKLAVDTGTITTFGTINIDSGNSGEWRTATAADVDALMNNGTTHVLFLLSATKTGTPGNLYVYPVVTYRIVAT